MLNADRWHKLLRRGWTVLQNAAHQLMQPFLNIIVSALVIRQTSETVWGAFISILILVQLSATVSAWGSKDYLLRAFSRDPHTIPQQWQANLFTRAGITLLACALTVFYAASVQQAGLLALWIVLLVLATAFDVIIVYRRAFPMAIATDLLVTALRAGVVVALGASLTADHLIALFVVTTGLKAVIYMVCFSDILRPLQFDIKPTFYRVALPFFLLGFSGMLASRIDLYTVSVFESDAEVGRYQVFINLMLYLQALSQFILLPYVKTLYRMPDDSLYRVGRRLFLLGCVMVPLALLASDVLLRVVYNMRFSPGFIVLGGMFVLPIYAYLPLIHRLYSRDEQRHVLTANVVGAVLNLIGNIVLLPRLGIAGALLSSGVMQWGMLIYYVYKSAGQQQASLSGVFAGD
ncbi:MAG: polysaccharide biosynthesis C-terminal domain-containing protein [Chloroflexota bacterium]